MHRYPITQTNALYINQDIHKYLLQTKLSRYVENRAIKMFSEYELNILFYRMQTYTKDAWYEIIQNLSSHVHYSNYVPSTNLRPDQYKMKILVFSIQYDFQILKYQYQYSI